MKSSASFSENWHTPEKLSLHSYGPEALQKMLTPGYQHPISLWPKRDAKRSYNISKAEMRELISELPKNVRLRFNDIKGHGHSLDVTGFRELTNTEREEVLAEIARWENSQKKRDQESFERLKQRRPDWFPK
jgi:hypothetical protein